MYYLWDPSVCVCVCVCASVQNYLSEYRMYVYISADFHPSSMKPIYLFKFLKVGSRSCIISWIRCYSKSGKVCQVCHLQTYFKSAYHFICHIFSNKSPWGPQAVNAALKHWCQPQSQRGPKLKSGTTSRAKQGQHLCRIDRILDKVQKENIFRWATFFFYVHVPEPYVWHLFLAASSLMFGVRFCAAETLMMEWRCESLRRLLWGVLFIFITEKSCSHRYAVLCQFTLKLNMFTFIVHLFFIFN